MLGNTGIQYIINKTTIYNNIYIIIYIIYIIIYITTSDFTYKGS